MLFQRRGETLKNIDAELVLEVGRLDMSQLQKQDELANQPVVVAQGHAASDGQFAAGVRSVYGPKSFSF